jgi:hypothetical protein
VVLHRDKWSESVVQCIVCSDCKERGGGVELGPTLHSVELPRITATHSNITHPTRFDNIVKSLHSLPNGCLVVGPVALKDIDVVGLETFERRFYRIENVLAR